MAKSISKEIDRTIAELLIIGDIFMYPESNSELMSSMVDIGNLVFKTQSAKALWEPVSKFYKEYGHLPVDDITINTIFNDKQRELLDRAIEEAAEPFEDAEHFKKEFMTSVMTVKLKHTIADLENDVSPNHHGTIDADNALARALNNLDQVSRVSASLSAQSTFAGSLSMGLAAADNFSLREQGERIPIPIEGLAMSNSFIEPGTFRGDLNMFVAPAGRGKTTVLSALAAEYARSFGGVLYVTLETSVTPILFKMCSYLTDGIVGSHDYLKKREEVGGRNLLDTYPQTAVQSLQSIPHEIQFMDYTCGETLTSDAIGRKVRQLRKFNNVDIDIVIVDYIDLLQSNRGGSGNTSNTSGGAANLADIGFSYQLLVADELRMMAQQNNVVVWTATQAGKASSVDEAEMSKYRPLSQKDVFGSDGKMQFGSIMFGLGLVKMDHGIGVGVMSKMKDRHSIGNMAQYYKAILDYKLARLTVEPVDMSLRQNSTWPDLVNAWIKEEQAKIGFDTHAKRRTVSKIGNVNHLFQEID